jgi:hypothetical protein
MKLIILKKKKDNSKEDGIKGEEDDKNGTKNK